MGACLRAVRMVRNLQRFIRPAVRRVPSEIQNALARVAPARSPRLYPLMKRGGFRRAYDRFHAAKDPALIRFSKQEGLEYRRSECWAAVRGRASIPLAPRSPR